MGSIKQFYIWVKVKKVTDVVSVFVLLEPPWNLRETNFFDVVLLVQTLKKTAILRTQQSVACK